MIFLALILFTLQASTSLESALMKKTPFTYTVLTHRLRKEKHTEPILLPFLYNSQQNYLTWDCALTLAAFATNTLTTSVCPAKDAMCNAVFPFWNQREMNCENALQCIIKFALEKLIKPVNHVTHSKNILFYHNKTMFSGSIILKDKNWRQCSNVMI